MEFDVKWLPSLRAEFAAEAVKYEQAIKESGIAYRRGTWASNLIHHLRFEAIAAYILDHDTERFRDKFAECVELKIRLFEAKHSGEDIMPHLVNLGSNGFIEYAYAAQRPDLAKQVVQVLDGDIKDQEKFNFLVKAVKHLVLGDRTLAKDLMNRVHDLPDDKWNWFRGYWLGVRGIINGNEDEFNKGLVGTAIEHRRQCHLSFGEIVGTEQELLSLYGIGLANLGIFEGLTIDPSFESKYIPRDLLASK